MKLFKLIYVVTVISLFAFCSLSQAELQLDSEFGKNGVITTDFGIYNDEAKAIAVQKDGKIIVAGFTDNGANTDLAVARYNPDGTLDTDFNYTGKISLAIGNDDDSVNALTVQDDGKILLVGTSSREDEKDLILVRLHKDGLLDRDFDDDGFITLDLSTGDDVAYDLILQTDGKVLVAGSSQQDEKSQATIVRLNVDGSKDLTFAKEGVFVTGNDTESVAYALSLQTDGKILFTGYEKAETQKRAFVSRLQTTGELDATFATDGTAYVNVEGSGDTISYDIEVQNNQKILLAGSTQENDYRKVLLARFLQDGKADTVLGESGVLISDLGYDAIAYALAIQGDSTAFVAGYGLRGDFKDLALLEYDISEEIPEDGEFVSVTKMSSEAEDPGDDASENDQKDEKKPKIILTDVEQLDDIGKAVVVQDNGQILTAGSADNGKDTDFVIVRYASSVELYSDPLRSGGNYHGGQYYISTIPVSMVTRTSAATGGYIGMVSTAEEDDTVHISSRGVCYGITSYPVVKESSTSASTSSSSSATATGTDDESGFAHKEIPYNIVREGCTEDGDGAGHFRSDILRVTPDTLYYVRAYLTLSDTAGTTYYGNQLTFKTEDACFIATAAYGSSMEPKVHVLQEFRDNYLKQNVLGRRFIALYYHYSPPMAEFISQHDTLRAVTRTLLMPFVWLCSLL